MPVIPDLDACQARLQYQFKDPSYLLHALTHSSIKGPDLPSNERMEFLGDAILGQEVSLYLFQKFKDFQEGDLTKVKSVVVSRATLATVCREMNLGEFVILGKGIERQALPTSLLANIFEAIIAAIFLDSGIRNTRKFIRLCLIDQVNLVVADAHSKNYKSLLQHYAQKNFKITPEYNTVQESGPDHNKTFVVQVSIHGTQHGSGTGRSKKEAEQDAARSTLRELHEEE